ncbi:hypothetical protein HDU82_004592 [Entophlyctis luteolus]|nr:hypothetical protein HDU82_004592 [Entophlyctis luteolus]
MQTRERNKEDPAAPISEALATLQQPPALPDSPLRAAAALVLMPFCQGMFYGLGEGVARLLVLRWWGIETFSLLPTSGVTPSTAAKAGAVIGMEMSVFDQGCSAVIGRLWTERDNHKLADEGKGEDAHRQWREMLAACGLERNVVRWRRSY